MSGTFTAVDLSRLPAPAVVEPLDYEAIYAAILADFQARQPDFDATVESDPAVKLLEAAAWRELTLRARINDAARAVMLAFAVGADLDQLAALFGVSRLELAPADEEAGIPAVMESDVDFRRRVTIAPESYSVAGPIGAYIFHALTADADVLDASVYSPEPGQVIVTILSRAGNGEPDDELLDTVLTYLSDSTRRPLTDQVLVEPANVIEYEVAASIVTFPGPDAAVVLAAARARLDALLEGSHRLGRDVMRSAIIAALHVDGVHHVELTAPAEDLVLDVVEAPWCTAIHLTGAGVEE